jgi:hypothetical protein
MTYTLKDVVRCINHWLPETREYIWSRTTYIAFLTQYDILRRWILKKATKYTHQGQPITKTTFYINYSHIIESEDINDIVYKDFIGEYSIPPQIEKRIKTIINKYAGYKNWQISLKIRRMLGLTVEKWRDYAGMYIDEYLYTEGYRLRHREI